MVSKKLYKKIKAISILSKHGIYIGKKNYNSHRIFSIISYSSRHDEEQYPLWENIQHENKELVPYLRVCFDTDCIYLSELGEQALEEYKLTKMKTINEWITVTISIIALVISIIAISLSI